MLSNLFTDSESLSGRDSLRELEENIDTLDSLNGDDTEVENDQHLLEEASATIPDKNLTSGKKRKLDQQKATALNTKSKRERSTSSAKTMTLGSMKPLRQIFKQDKECGFQSVTPLKEYQTIKRACSTRESSTYYNESSEHTPPQDVHPATRQLLSPTAVTKGGLFQ